jgi:tight adherence protein C
MFIIQTGILSKKSIADLEQTLAAGGFRSASALPLVIGSKVALLFVLPLAAWALSVSLGVAHGSTKMMMFCGAAAIALLAPERIVSHLRNRYLGEVERSLPDALDLLVICADAGLPLEAALERVAAELRNGSAPTANELALTASEMKLLPDRRQALVNLGTRTGLETLVSLGGTLAQTLKYGTPITQALRVLSNDLRHVMLTRYEERAARLPVLLTLPMIGFFVPCVLLIVAGPAAVQVYHMLSHT